jgi:hypothetical protein
MAKLNAYHGVVVSGSQAEDGEEGAPALLFEQYRLNRETLVGVMRKWLVEEAKLIAAEDFPPFEHWQKPNLDVPDWYFAPTGDMAEGYCRITRIVIH